MIISKLESVISPTQLLKHKVKRRALLPNINLIELHRYSIPLSDRVLLFFYLNFVQKLEVFMLFDKFFCYLLR